MDIKTLVSRNISILNDNINNLKENLTDKNFNKLNIGDLFNKPEISKIKSAIIGGVVGDALGAPYEFKKSEEIKLSDVRKMEGGGRWGR